MKQRLFIFGSLALLVILMIGLNAASYVQKAKEPDNEIFPNRSSYNPGSTGSMAYYSLLAETGRSVRRWQLPIASLESNDKNRPSTFIIVGPLKRPFTKDEHQDLLNWTASGGRLVLIDRNPDNELLATTAEWTVTVSPSSMFEFMSVDPADQTQMTAETAAAKPTQITLMTAGVNAIQTSRFASDIKFERHEADEYDEDTYSGPADSGTIYGTGSDSNPQSPPPAKEPVNGEQTADSPPLYTIKEEQSGNDESHDIYPQTLKTPRFLAPVSHFSSEGNDVVVEIPYGGGRVIYVADPFIVSNGGINMADNVQFALNLAGSGNIVFDEFHHGFGSGNNRILEYFSGTPLVAILLQMIALIFFVMVSRSRRFARAVPEPEPNRLTKLEYVEAMADIQRRTKAYDLAIENIYADLRRRVSRIFGLDAAATPRKDIASRIAERANIGVDEIERLMARSEDIIHGDNTDRAEVLRLAAQLREIEEQLNLSRKPRTRI